MAASVTSAWAKPGAWALDAEESEAAAVEAQPEPADFPSLAAAAKSNTKKKSKKVSLAEFTTGQSVALGAGRARPESTRLTTDEMLSLPTGPRERTAEELERGPSYRGFNSYGYGSREPRGSEEPRRGRGDSAGGFREPLPPSRADEIDDWGATKRSSAGPPPPSERRDRGGMFFDSQSRADESDSWISGKSAAAALPSNGRRAEVPRERRGGFEFHKEVGGGADAESWGRRREEPAVGAGPGAGFGRPKLVLQPRTLPIENSPACAEQQQPPPPVQAVKAKAANPFGAARPREEVLAEKGQDWKKLDEKLDNMKIREPRPISREGSGGFGRRGSAVEVERNWRKDDSSMSPPPPPTSESSEPAEQSASDN